MKFVIDDEAGAAAVFTYQVVVGTAMFAVVLLVAFGLSHLVGWMAAAGAPSWMVSGAHYAEIGLFVLDLFLFSLFLISEALRFVMCLWKEWRH